LFAWLEGRADNTRRAYRTAVARFTHWCHEHGQSALDLFQIALGLVGHLSRP